MAALNRRLGSDHFLEMGERHVREGEQRVLRQMELIAELEAAGRHDTARVARELLTTLTKTLNTARAHLAHLAQEHSGLAMQQVELSPRPASPPLPASE